MLTVPSNEYQVKACLVTLLTDRPEPRQIMPARCRELDTVPDVFVPEYLWLRHLFPSLAFIVLCLSLGLTPLASSSCSALHLGLGLVCLPLTAFYPKICARDSTGKCISAGRAACSKAKGFPLGHWEAGRQSRVQ